MPKSFNKLNKREVFLAKISRKGLFTVEEAKNFGISQPTLSRLAKEKLIIRVARGQYLHAEYDNDIESMDFSMACRKFGKQAVIGGMSALAHYNLVDEVPKRIWVLVPADVKSKESLYRCIRTTTNLKHGVVNMGKYKIVNIDRAIVEAFKFSSKIGLSIVIKAARRALNSRQTNEKDLLAVAKKLGLESCILKYWEAISPEANPF